MNLPKTISAQSPQPLQIAQDQDGDGIDLLDLMEVIVEQRWLVVGIAAAVFVLGVIYAFLGTPVYEANTLIQVEDNKSAAGFLGDASSLFDIKSPATAEIEILRSRLVVGQAVSNLQLDIDVRPKYLPLIGRWLSRRADGPSNPGFLGMGGYVSGTEELRVAHLLVPKSEEDERLSLVVTPEGYQLELKDGTVLGQGRLGQPMAFKFEDGNGELLVTSLIGKPGAQFYLTKLSRLAVIEQLQKDLVIVEKGKQSGVISSTLQGNDASLTAATLNEISRFYVRQNIERKAAEAEKSISFLNRQLPELRKQLESSEEKFNQFRNRSGTFNLTDEGKALLEASAGLSVKRIELQQKRKELEFRFTPQHPSVQAIDAQIGQIDSQMGAMESKAKRFPNVEQDLLRLTRDVKVNVDLYTTLFNSFEQLRLVKEGKVGNVRLVDAAVVPEIPVKPQKALVIALSSVMGLIAGLGITLLRNNLRPGIKHADDIEQHLGMHVFATVPHSEAQVKIFSAFQAKTSSLTLLAESDPSDPCVESLRSLRTALQFAMLDTTNNIVLLTGPTPAIGKSFATANFGAVLAAGGKRVLLIDADMRKGHLHEYFGLKRGHGLSELISGTQTLEQVVHKTTTSRLDFISTGPLPPNPAEMLMSPVTVALMQTLSTLYDIVLLDTPPVLAVSDTAVLAPMAGTVFMLARAGVTTLAELQESTKRLARSGVTVRGVIFNDLNLSKRRYGYGYKYSRYRYARYEYENPSK